MSDEHEKLKTRVFNAMLKKAGIAPSAPLSPQLRQDFEVAADVLIRSTKRPLDPKKIAKHVESIQHRHQNRERDSILPPIFVKTMNDNNVASRSTNFRTNARNDHVGKAADHFDRVERENAWATQVKKESEEYARNETERQAREEREKRARLDLLKQQVEEDQRRKEQEREELKKYMDKKQAEGRLMEHKQDMLESQRKQKRLADRYANEEYLEAVRERKAREKKQKEEQERQFIEKLNELESAEANAEKRKRLERMQDMRTFLQSNRKAEEEHRNRMIQNRQEEIKVAPTQGIFFDGGDRRSNRVLESSTRKNIAYRNFENRIGADTHRDEEREKLYKALSQPDDLGVRQLEEEQLSAREKKFRQQAELRKGLQEQMQQHARERGGDKQYGAWKITQKGRKQSNSNAGLCIPGLDGDTSVQDEEKRIRDAQMREELRKQATEQKRARRHEVTMKI